MKLLLVFVFSTLFTNGLCVSPPSIRETKDDKLIVMELQTMKIQMAEVAKGNGHVVEFRVGILPYNPGMGKFIFINAPGKVTYETIGIAYELL